MNDLHVTLEPERILTPTLLMRPWSAEDAAGAFEIYGDPATAQAIGRRHPVRDLAEMGEVLGSWNLQSSRSPLPRGLWAVESADDGRLLGGATLLPFSPHHPELVMGWQLRPGARGHGLAGQIVHALAHRAFFAGDVEEVFVVGPAQHPGRLTAAQRQGMTRVEGLAWTHGGVRLEVLRLHRADLHKIRPGISLDNAYDPEGLGDW
jgi:RimJ/RimL family protein N-acetyltransferase